MKEFPVMVYVDFGYGCRYIQKTLLAPDLEAAKAEIKKANDKGTICFLVEQK